ncbi:MAG TPA: S8 family peptidase [bacterium]|nr:S8 family peptidase [bacterium]
MRELRKLGLIVLLLFPSFSLRAQPTDSFSLKVLNRVAPVDAQPQAAPPADALAAPSPSVPALPPCRSLSRIAPQLYRCGEFLVQLNAGTAFPEDLKTKSWREALKALKGQGAIAKTWVSSPDDIVLQAAPNDPRFTDESYFNGDGTAVDVGALEAWGTVTGRSDVIVAVIDSGLAVDHPDLKDNVWKNTGETPGNGVDDDVNGLVDDVNGFDFEANVPSVADAVGHGTNMAGVIGAVGNNGTGMAGLNWAVQIMPLKFTGSAGTGSLAAALEAIDYAIQYHARVINASWTLAFTGADATDKAALLSEAVQSAVDAGIVFAAASGNQFESGVGKDIDAEPAYPASSTVDGLIAVAAVNRDGTLASFANFGAASVDLAAPGASVLTTSSDGDFSFSKGTSIATALVSGASALLLANQPSLTPVQVKKALLDHVVPEATLSGKVASGGRLSLKGLFASSTSSSSTPSLPPSSGDASSASSVKSAAESSEPAKGGCSLRP